MNTYKLLERAYLNNRLCEAGEIVRLNDNPKKGGHPVGACAVPCDENGNEVVRRGRKADESVDDIA